MKRLKTEGIRLFNEKGAQVLLSGLNVVCKKKELGYVEPLTEEDFKWFRDQGHNVLRLGLIWDGVEPEPGVYDDVYLSKIKEQVKWAEKYGIYIFLDMHQDLYSVLYSDGAPEWATLTDDLPHVTGAKWSDAYLESPAVNRAIDHFWNNTEAEDGLGLQDHYRAMWVHVVNYFSDCSNIIGYDIMNEPYPGSRGQEVFGAILMAYAQIVLGIEDAETEELAELWFDEEKQQKVFEDIANMEIYKQLVTYAKEASQAFEKEVLSPFIERVAQGIREVDQEGFIMLETSYFANMGIESGIELVRDREGKIDPHQVYTPHGYDLVVDTDLYEIYNQDRVDLIFETHRKVQERLNIPTLIGEWGAFTNHQATPKLTKTLLQIFERNLWSHTYWCYTKDIREMPFVHVLNRAYPQETGGELLAYQYDDKTGQLEMTFIPNGQETILYHPNAAHLTDDQIKSTIEPKNVNIQPYSEADGGRILLQIQATDEEVTITIG